MWTEKTIKIQPVEGDTRMKVTFTLTDGTNDVTKETTVSTTKEVREAVQQNIKRLNERDEAIAAAKAGTLMDEPAPEAKTAEELAREAWLDAWERFKKAKAAMAELEAEGITPTEEETTRFSELRDWVIDNRKPEYSQYL